MISSIKAYSKLKWTPEVGHSTILGVRAASKPEIGEKHRQLENYCTGNESNIPVEK